MGATSQLYLLHSTKGEKLTDLQEFCATFCTKVLEARTLNRFAYGLPASIESVFAYGNDQSLEANLGRIMGWSMVFFHPLEHGWFLSTIKSSLFNIDGGKWSVWSCRFWLVYVICDLIMTIRNLQNAITGLEAKDLNSKDRSSLLKARRNSMIWLSCIFADLVLAWQYSVANGPFGERTLTWASWWGGFAGLYRRWVNAQ